jgi:hypothetical protein
MDIYNLRGVKMANTTYDKIQAADTSWTSEGQITAFEMMTGMFTCRLYNDSGTLKIGTGYIGIDDDTTQRIFKVDTVTTISVSGVSSSNWAAIEVAENSGAPVFTATNISGATDESTLPSDFTTGYDTLKNGYYINSTKRTLGIVWLNAGDTIEGLVVAKPDREGYTGYCQSDDGDDYPYKWNSEYLGEDNYEYYEYGENTNGTWERWDHSGQKIQRCRNNATISYLDADQLENTTITYSQEFVASPLLVIGGWAEATNLTTSERQGMSGIRIVSRTTTSWNCQYFNSNNDFDGDESVVVDYEAIGEWS